VIWQNPWAFLGLLAIVVPVIIHLLGRRNARITKFPTLRFVGASRLMATRWTRLSDVGLMLVRMGIIAASVVALAGPLLLTPDREARRDRDIVRAIIVDTSASMSRVAASGSAVAPGGSGGGISQVQTGRDVAMREATRLAAGAVTSVIVHTSTPSSALSGAIAGLQTRPGRREVAIVSDFQIGTLDEADIASIPRDFGIDLVRVAIAPGAQPAEIVSGRGSASVVARVSHDSGGANVEWTVRDQASAGRETGAGVTVLAGASERARANAAREAAMTVSALPSDGVRRPIAIVFPGYEGRAALVRDAQQPGEAWMGDAVVALARDPILVAAAREAELVDVAAESSFVTVARTAAGQPMAVAAHGSINGTETLLLFARVDAGSIASAVLIAAGVRASVVAAPVAELEPAALAEEAIAAWRRDAATSPERATVDSDLSDARWLWLIALILLGVEAWMRRARREPRVQEVPRARAA